jgi:FMNH2-dependent dimethyl sulfone monooxygenase
LRNTYGNPRPSVLPPILNAAGSGQGREFASKNANFLFTPAIDLERSKGEVAELKAMGQNKGRKVDVLTFSHVVCRPSEAEAKARWQEILDNADWAAVDNLVALQFAHAQSFPHDLLALIRERMAAGHGGFPLVGTPEQVADGICSLHATGFRGTTLSFVDYVEEFPYFRDNVLPILHARGIR